MKTACPGRRIGSLPRGAAAAGRAGAVPDAKPLGRRHVPRLAGLRRFVQPFVFSNSELERIFF